MDATLAEIRIFAGNFAPEGWKFCDGSLMSINDNSALFSLIGTTYGGDGQNTFALPDLRGRIAVGTGTGVGLAPIQLGEMAGSESIALTAANLPPHTHTAQVKTTVNAGTGTGATPANAYWGAANAPVYNATPGTDALNAAAIQPTLTASTTGNSTPVSNMQPYLVLNYCIAIEGIYPSRS